jgi:hypothetical protein
MSNRLNQSSSPRRRIRKQKSPLIRLVNVGIVALVVFYFGTLLFSEVERDAETLCRLDRAFSRDTAVLVDATEAYSPAHTNQISTLLQNILANAQVDEKFTFYSLGDAVNLYLPSFSICNPGDGSDQGELTTEQRRLFTDWKDNFHRRILSSIEALAEKEATDQSPIMEMIQYVTNQTRFTSPEIQKRLIIVSDMIHSTPSYSHYRDSKNFESVKNTDYQTGVQAYLTNVDVDVLYVQRPQLLAIQNRDHIESFWRPFVNSYGGRIVSVDRVNL